MILLKTLQVWKPLYKKPLSYFGRPLKLKVNKFQAGALSQNPQKEEVDNKDSSAEEQAKEFQKEEDADYNKKKASFKFRQFEEDEDDETTVKQILQKNSIMKGKEESNQEKSKQLKEQSDDDEDDNKKLKALGKEDNQIFTKEKIQFIKQSLLYEGDDPYYEKLVNRPEKGVVWGLGGELLRQQKNFFEKGKFPTVEQVISFLELEQAKDIICIDLEKECKRYDLPRNGIILSSFSCRHNYKIAANLLRAIKDLQIPEMENKSFKISGRKDDEWLLVDFNDIAVHMFVEEAREEIDLEWKWRNPPSEEEMKEFEKIQKHKSRKTFFEPLDDY